MSATAKAVASSARLPCRSRASSTAEIVRLPMSETLRGLSMPSRAFETRLAREQQQPEYEQADEDADGAQPQPRGRRCDAAGDGTAAAGAGRTGGDRGRRRCRTVVAASWRGAVGAAIVVAGVASAWRAVDRSRFHHCGEQAGDAGERRRHAGRVVGRGDRAESREAVDVGLGGRQADGLDVHTLDRGDASSSVAVLPSSLPSDSTTSTRFSMPGVNCWLAVTTAS